MFIDSGGTMLQYLPEPLKDDILVFMDKEEYNANQVVIEQNQTLDFIYFIASGHCDCVKSVFLPACGHRLLLNIGHLEQGL